MPAENRTKTPRALPIPILILLLVAGCAQPTPTAAPTEKAPPTATSSPTPEPVSLPGGALAPDGVPQEIYYAPFPVDIALDGDLADWDHVPTVTLQKGGSNTALTFAAAADDQYLYFMGNVKDDNIISGKHGTAYWNEDSVEFYVNGTGNQQLTTYEPGVVQMTVPAMNTDLPPDEAIVSGVQGDTAGAKVHAFKTDAGWAVEMAVPLKNDIWSIDANHGATIGFQVHLNGASSADRDLKVIWSKFDISDSSYQNPSVFGSLTFFEVGQTEIAEATITPTPAPTTTPVPIEPNAVYKDPDASVEDRAEDLLARMTLEEKIGQMTLVEKNSIKDPDLIDMYIGGLLSGGGGHPETNTAEGWAEMVDHFQTLAMQTRLGIPIIYGVDAVHGHNNVPGAVIFPQEVGLGAANDSDLMERIARVTAEEMIATGIYWDYAPVVAVPQDIRWGRTYEAYGENTDLVTNLSAAFIRGLQGDSLSDPLSVLATPKHFVGDGGTAWGSSTTENYKIDQGVMQVDEETLRRIHLPPYQRAVDLGAMSIMASYSSWQSRTGVRTKMHAQKYLLTDVLKGELGFDGFIVSDWGGIDQISPDDYYNAVVVATNAGIDMNMVPYDYARYVDTLTQAVEQGDVPMERIDDAVRRILRVKFALGLFEHPFSDPSLLASVGSAEHRAVAREAVSKSLVLLKNQGVFPIAKDVPTILVAGDADNIGFQSGGWTIEWQGGYGDITPGTSILKAIQDAVSPETNVIDDPYGRFNDVPDGTNVELCIAVVGEAPYAEGRGDSATLSLSVRDTALLSNLRKRCDKLAVILISGRPLIITDQLAEMDALVAAWLPGTEGGGIADVIFGDKPFTGKLPYTWPRSVDQLPLDFSTLKEANVLFPFGFGLTD